MDSFQGFVYACVGATLGACLAVGIVVVAGELLGLF